MFVLERIFHVHPFRLTSFICFVPFCMSGHISTYTISVSVFLTRSSFAKLDIHTENIPRLIPKVISFLMCIVHDNRGNEKAKKRARTQTPVEQHKSKCSCSMPSSHTHRHRHTRAFSMYSCSFIFPNYTLLENTYGINLLHCFLQLFLMTLTFYIIPCIEYVCDERTHISPLGRHGYSVAIVAIVLAAATTFRR